MLLRFNIRQLWLAAALFLPLVLPLVLPLGLAAQTPKPDPSPDKPGTFDGRSFLPSQIKPGEGTEPIRRAALRLDSLAIVRLSTGTEIGNPQDYLLIVYGDGFWETEYAPKLHLSPSLILDQTTVSQDGKVLYVTVPAAMVSKIKALNLREIQVQNPGGLDLDPKRWRKLALPRGINEALGAAKPGKLKVENYFPVLAE
jgi:hypothetical protein